VIPVYNSADIISDVVSRIQKVLIENNYNFEIILVDDGSRDNTWNILVTLFNKYDNIKILRLAKNFGEHNAVYAGLFDSKGEYAIIMDDDGQNPPEILPKLIQYAQDNDTEVVYTYYRKKKHSFFRNLGSKFANWCATITLKKPKDLYLSSFKLIKRRVINEIMKYQGSYPYIDGLIFFYTSKIAKIEVPHNSRKIGKSNYNIYLLLKLWSNIIFNFSIYPIRFALLLGLFFFVFAVSYSIYTIYERLFLNSSMPIGYASLIILILYFFSLTLIFLGIIGEYVGRISMNINQKPLFSILEKYEKN
ncbi:MAG TPA: glycosyltransferase family 2 protein, partial [bacterium]|nr:glycosyltransferase family 2 protein [bacterium]